MTLENNFPHYIDPGTNTVLEDDYYLLEHKYHKLEDDYENIIEAANKRINDKNARIKELELMLEKKNEETDISLDLLSGQYMCNIK